MQRMPMYPDVVASGAAGLVAAAVFAIGNHLLLPVFSAVFCAVMGMYAGGLLSGSGWRHHLGARVAFVVALLAAFLVWGFVS